MILLRSASESDLGTDSVDERLETLLQLLGGARTGGGSSNGGAAPDLVAGTGRWGNLDSSQFHQPTCCWKWVGGTNP